jgi:hypothetical protein
VDIRSQIQNINNVQQSTQESGLNSHVTQITGLIDKTAKNDLVLTIKRDEPCLVKIYQKQLDVTNTTDILDKLIFSFEYPGKHIKTIVDETGNIVEQSTVDSDTYKIIFNDDLKISYTTDVIR